MPLLLAGCVLPSPSPVEPGAEPSSAVSGISLHETLRLTLAEQLAPETVESLRVLAVEHTDHSTLLRLPGIAEDFRAGVAFPDETLWTLLDDAIAYQHLLAIPPGSDMEKERSFRVAQRLGFVTAANWARLAAVREKIALANSSAPALRQQETELRLELRAATGLSRSGIDHFAYETLVVPRLLVCDLSRLQTLAARQRSESQLPAFPPDLPGRVLVLPGVAGAELPRLAELLYRLPRGMAERQLASPVDDHHLLSSLASAVGIAFEVEFSWRRLREAWERFDLARRKAELAPASMEDALILIDARRDWRIAYYRFLTDLGADLTVPFDELADVKTTTAIPTEMVDDLLLLLHSAGN